ncbi:unnamed protein product [Prorocentrum cordatum]|uniref:Uncharacterized protein n=1 Tax=Prorocentrum cordatum TaxID=2364126 RepID=A0ABN9WE63_9DINO|nr:unnamed protein product [Polarella glacialis]
MEYYWKFAVTKRPCWSHEAHKSMDVALKAADLQQFWLVNLIRLDVRQGPHDDDARLHQVREHMAHYLKRTQHNMAPLFSDLCVEIAGGFERKGMVFDPAEPLDQQV